MARTKQTARKSFSGKSPVSAKKPKLPGMRGLMERLFAEGKTAFQARFALAKCPQTDERPATSGRHSHFEVIAHDCVLAFLGPHEILALLSTSRGAWAAVGPRQRRFAVLRSLFAYLRISEEAAQSVRDNFRGGWRSFAPVLVRMCEHLTRVYGHLEPDPAHRAFLAEQACFPNGYGTLVAHEMFRVYPILTDNRGEADEQGGDDLVARVKSVPTLDSLKSVGSRCICWGDFGPCITAYNDSGMGDWLERNLAWMRENSRDEENEHYRRRLESGLHPPIWIMYDTGSEPIEWALGIGPSLEQFVDYTSSYYELSTWEDQREKLTNTFWCCFDKDNISGRDSLVAFLVDYACSPEEMHDRTPTLSVAIWCMRHGLEPFTDRSINWSALITEELRERDFDPEFLTEAITSPFFGPADVDKYKE